MKENQSKSINEVELKQSALEQKSSDGIESVFQKKETDVNIEKVSEAAKSESLSESNLRNNDLRENIDFTEKTVQAEANKSEKYVEQEGSALKFSSEDEEKLKGLEKADSKSLSDAIDIYKDGKFDNDSHGDKMGNREKHEQSMRM